MSTQSRQHRYTQHDTLSVPDHNAISQHPTTEEEQRRERASELFQYGFEIKYLPLARYLQTASKYISTETWSAAREELRMTRIFDKYLELRSSKALTLQQLRPQTFPMRTRTLHDAMLEEACWMANDMACERDWKRAMARQLAQEARELYLKRQCVWFTSKSLGKCREQTLPPPPFFPADTPSITMPWSPCSETTLMSIEEDRQLTGLGCRDKWPQPLDQRASELIPLTEYQLGASTATPGWYEHEDHLLLSLGDRYLRNWRLISHALNMQVYGGKPIRGPVGCEQRFAEISRLPAEQDAAIVQEDIAFPFIHPHLLEKHNVKLNMMRGASTKIITPRSVVPKKISFNVHPSHEAAARKANQNISKLLTPSELAQRRLQRTRMGNDGGPLNMPSIPRSTPSPTNAAPSSATAGQIVNASASGSSHPAFTGPTGTLAASASASAPALATATMTAGNAGPLGGTSGSNLANPAMLSIPNLPSMSPMKNASSANATLSATAMASLPSSVSHNAVQQIAAGMMRAGMMRPPGGIPVASPSKAAPAPPVPQVYRQAASQMRPHAATPSAPMAYYAHPSQMAMPSGSGMTPLQIQQQQVHMQNQYARAMAMNMGMNASMNAGMNAGMNTSMNTSINAAMNTAMNTSMHANIGNPLAAALSAPGSAPSSSILASGTTKQPTLHSTSNTTPSSGDQQLRIQSTAVPRSPSLSLPPADDVTAADMESEANRNVRTSPRKTR